MYYFAYGSNMSVQRMNERGVVFTRRIPAVLYGYRLEFNKLASKNPKEGYANIIPDQSKKVEGALYEISDNSLERLDNYEGYPTHYERVKIRVQLNDRQEVEAVAYIAQSTYVQTGLKPSRKYLNYLLAGEDVLSDEYYNWLKETETLD